MCPDATDEEIDELLNLADTNKDGKLDREGIVFFTLRLYALWNILGFLKL